MWLNFLSFVCFKERIVTKVTELATANRNEFHGRYSYLNGAYHRTERTI